MYDLYGKIFEFLDFKEVSKNLVKPIVIHFFREIKLLRKASFILNFTKSPALHWKKS